MGAVQIGDHLIMLLFLEMKLCLLLGKCELILLFQLFDLFTEISVGFLMLGDGGA